MSVSSDRNAAVQEGWKTLNKWFSDRGLPNPVDAGHLPVEALETALLVTAQRMHEQKVYRPRRFERHHEKLMLARAVAHWLGVGGVTQTFSRQRGISNEVAQSLLRKAEKVGLINSRYRMTKECRELLYIGVDSKVRV